VPVYEGDQALHFLCGLIVSVQRALRRRAAISAALWGAAAVMASLAALLAADAAARFPGAARGIIYAAAWLAGVGVAAAVTARAWRRRPSALYVARLIELERPELKNALITFLELHSDPLADMSMSAAVGRRAARLLADAEPGAFLPPAGLRRPAMAAAGAALVLAAGIWLAQGILFPPWVPAARASLATSVPGRPADRDAPGSAPDSGAPRPVLSGREERTEDAIEDDRDQGKGAAAGRELAAALKADAAKFDRLAAALEAEANNSPAGAAGRQGATPDGAAVSPRPGGSANQSGGRQGAQSSGGPSEHGRPASAKGEPAAGAGGSRQTAQSGAAGQNRGDGGTAAQLPSSGAGGQPESTGATTRISRQGESGGTDAATPPRPGQGAGGSPGSAASGGRGPAAEPPLARHKPSDEFPPEVLDFIRRAKRLITKADERLREGEASETLLREAEMSHEELRRFVTSWQRKFEAAPDGPDSVPVSAASAPAGPTHGEVLRAAQAPCVSPHAGPLTLRADGQKGLVQAGEARVSPRLRPAVAAYFEEVGRLTGPREAKGASP